MSMLNNYKKVLYCDSEGTGLDHRRDKMTVLQVKEGNKPGKLYRKPSEWKKFKKDFEDPNILKVWHNLQHDYPFFYAATGIRMRGCACTMIREKLLKGVGQDENGKTIPEALKPKYSSSLYHTLKRRGIAVLDKTNQKSDWSGELDDSQTDYALEDIEHLPELYAQQQVELEERNLDLLAELEAEVSEALSMMKINGVQFDVTVWLEECERWRVICSKILEEMPCHINWNSPAQIKKLFARRGVIIETLKNLDKQFPRGLDPLLDKLMDLRKGYSYTTMFGPGWLTETKTGRPVIHTDGRIRVTYDQIVSTGRTSSYNPNGQNLPDLGKSNHRKAFIAAPGTKLCIADFTGQELGIAAIAANERRWIDAMLEGKDVHSIMAAGIFRRTWEEKTEPGCKFPYQCECTGHKKLRKQSKAINFGLLYGKTAMALAVDLGCSVEEAQVLINAFFQEAPTLKKYLYIKGKHAENFKEAFTLPPFNRYRNLELEPFRWRRRNQGKNTPIQGTGADILKIALVYINRYIFDHKLFDKVKLVMQIHDEIITEVQDDFAEEWLAIKRQLMVDAALAVTKVKVIDVTPFLAEYWRKEEEKVETHKSTKNKNYGKESKTTKTRRKAQAL